MPLGGRIASLGVFVIITIVVKVIAKIKLCKTNYVFVVFKITIKVIIIYNKAHVSSVNSSYILRKANFYGEPMH